MSAKKYLIMADVFELPLNDDDRKSAVDLFSHMVATPYSVDYAITLSKYAAHAINSHDELVESRDELLYQLEEMTSIVRQNTYPQPDKPNSTWGCLVEAEAVIRKIKGGAS